MTGRSYPRLAAALALAAALHLAVPPPAAAGGPEAAAALVARGWLNQPLSWLAGLWGRGAIQPHIGLVQTEPPHAVGKAPQEACPAQGDDGGGIDPDGAPKAQGDDGGGMDPNG